MSMKKLLIGLGALLLAIIILTAMAPNWNEVNVETDDNSEEPLVLEEKPAPEKTVAEEAPETKVVTKEPVVIDSIVFGYSTLSFTQAIDIYYAKGDKIKIVLPKPIDVGMKRYDTVYVDRTRKKAIGYCEEKGYCKDRNKEIEISFETYDAPTPLDWKFSMDNYVTDDITNGKKAEVYLDNGVRYWIDTYLGLPVKVNDVEGEHYYNILSLNKVKDEDLVHQQLENY